MSNIDYAINMVIRMLEATNKGSKNFFRKQRNKFISEMTPEELKLYEHKEHSIMGMKTIERGFSLAELMIGLSILGLIATLTLPSLFSKVQELSDRAVMKSNISALQHVMMRYAADGGMEALYIPRGSYTKTQLDQTFADWNVSKVCTADQKANLASFTAKKPIQTPCNFTWKNKPQPWGAQARLYDGTELTIFPPTLIWRDVVTVYLKKNDLEIEMSCLTINGRCQPSAASTLTYKKLFQ